MENKNLSFLRNCFNEVDPIGISSEDNLYEYDLEINALLNSNVDFLNLDSIKKGILSILESYFEDVQISDDDIETLANKIFQGNSSRLLK